MSKLFLPHLSPQERRRALEDNADKIEETTYLRDLTQEELDGKREALVDNLIKISGLEDELDAQKEYYKGQIKPLHAVNRILQSEVKTRKTEIKGNLYHIAIHEDGIMETYDENGEFISSRRLRPDEKSKVLQFTPAANQ